MRRNRGQGTGSPAGPRPSLERLLTDDRLTLDSGLRGLATLSGGRSALLARSHANAVEIVAAWSLTAAQQSAWREHLSTHEPTAPHWNHLPLGRPQRWHASCVTDARARRIPAACQAFLEKEGVGSCLGARLDPVSWRQGDSVVVFVLRPASHAVFGPAESAAFRKAQPYLQAAYSAHRQVRELGSHVAMLEELLGRIPFALLVTDADGVVQFANRSADDLAPRVSGLLEAGPGSWCEGRRLAGAARAAVKAVLRGGEPSRILSADLEEGGRAVVTVTRQGAEGAPDGGRALVGLGCPASLSSIPSLEGVYGLTWTESALARQLLTGQSLEKTAAALGISPNTAKTHLKRIYAKTGVTRQAEATLLLHRTCCAVVSGIGPGRRR